VSSKAGSDDGLAVGRERRVHDGTGMSFEGDQFEIRRGAGVPFQAETDFPVNPDLQSQRADIHNHCVRSIDRVFGRFHPALARR